MFRGNTRKSRRKMSIGVQRGGAGKKRDLQEQVEQVKKRSRRHPGGMPCPAAAARRDSIAAISR
jgi:hypothetical protein